MPNITITFNSDEVSLATSVLQFIDGNTPFKTKADTTKQISGQAAQLELKQTNDVEPLISPKSETPSATSAASSKVTQKEVREALSAAKKQHGLNFVMSVLVACGGENKGTMTDTFKAMDKSTYPSILENLNAAKDGVAYANEAKSTEIESEQDEPVKGASMFDESDAKAEATEVEHKTNENDDLDDDLGDDLDDDLDSESAADIDPEAVVKAVRAFAKTKTPDEAKAAMKKVGAKNTRAIPDLNQAKLAELLKLVA